MKKKEKEIIEKAAQMVDRHINVPVSSIVVSRKAIKNALRKLYSESEKEDPISLFSKLPPTNGRMRDYIVQQF